MRSKSGSDQKVSGLVVRREMTGFRTCFEGRAKLSGIPRGDSEEKRWHRTSRFGAWPTSKGAVGFTVRLLEFSFGRVQLEVSV